ncbi:OsmC family protein [Rhodoferax sp.]|uniref:OsmC family protein n=1 Tax=Rhodoferax sp. TaxID=50421 RepID=UPI00274BEB3B|nr:OsmC family protein [Rhodoferax sp.]
MSSYTATIVWQRDAQAFVDHRYSRRHTWHFDGGAVVSASASPQIVALPMSDAASVDPEEAFVASLSSCHMLWFLDIAARAGWVVDHYRDDATGLLARDAKGLLAMTRVTLRPAVRFAGERTPSAEAHLALHHQAHAACFIANSVKTEVLCQPVLEPILDTCARSLP